MIEKKTLTSYAVLVFSIVISFALIIIPQNPTYHVMGFWLTVVVAVFVSKLEIMNPLFWFPVSFGLYSTSYSLVYILGYEVASGYTRENILLQFIALIIVILVMGFNRGVAQIDIHYSRILRIEDKLSLQLTKMILLGLLILLLCSVIYLFNTPFNHKNEMLGSRNYFFIIGAYSTRFLSLFNSLYILQTANINMKKISPLILLTSILVVLFSLFTGEKDAMFRFFLVIIISMFIVGRINKKTILLLMPIGMLYLVVSGYFKYYFVNGELKESLEEQSFIYNFLNSDFNAAGENFQILLNNPWTNSFHSYSNFFVDLIKPFLPGGMFMNIGNWFNETFYPNSYSRAFTLVGQAYVINGVVGIVILFLFIGLMVRILQRYAIKNIYLMAIYIYSVPTVISAFRSTLNTILSDLIRIAIFGLLIHYILYRLIKNKKI